MSATLAVAVFLGAYALIATEKANRVAVALTGAGLIGSYVTHEGRKRPSTCRNTAQMGPRCSQKELLPHSVLRWDQALTAAKGAQKVTQTGLM